MDDQAYRSEEPLIPLSEAFRLEQDKVGAVRKAQGGCDVSAARVALVFQIDRLAMHQTSIFAWKLRPLL